MHLFLFFRSIGSLLNILAQSVMRFSANGSIFNILMASQKCPVIHSEIHLFFSNTYICTTAKEICLRVDKIFKMKINKDIVDKKPII